jgi:hypothetical protein
MCYRCQVCSTVTQKRESLRKHTVMREVPLVKNRSDLGVRKEIAEEIQVCHSCYQLLQDGVPFPVLVKQNGKPIIPKIVLSPTVPTVGTVLRDWPASARVR